MKSPGEQTADDWCVTWCRSLQTPLRLPAFRSPELSAEKLPPNTQGKLEEGNWEDMGCGVDELLSHNRCAIERDQRKCVPSAMRT